MEDNVTNTCPQHKVRSECPDLFMTHNKRLNEYGINIFGSPSYVIINFCPWCGSKLPASKR